MTYDLSRRDAAIRADLSGMAATVRVGEGDSATNIEIMPTGALPGDYFVGTFSEGRMTGLVTLSEDYDVVRRIDFAQMVEAERDVSRFPRIAVVDTGGERRLEIVGGGMPTRIELDPLPEMQQQAA